MLGMYVFKNSTMYKKKKRRLAGGGVNETVVYFIKERSLDTLIKILHTKKHEKKSIFSPKQKQNKKPMAQSAL